MSKFQGLSVLFDVAWQSGDPLANVVALLGLSDNIDFGRFTRDDQEGAETAFAEIRPTTESVTHCAPTSRDVNREAPPQAVPTCAATVGESAGNSLPSSEVLLQSTLSLMQSLASALPNTVQAPVQTVRPHVKVDINTCTGYHVCKSANEYLDQMLYCRRRRGFLMPNFLSVWSRCRSRSKRLNGSD
ncbi:hypothetical protein HPB51_001638 [Rhipicephalus microplus]|uniref:Uncharacterized protein n=1 Tax=Rhipicephalus microplus TaxID=6941 RepID=A0A9J6EW24_RHIMP|nr:hypothetical protein HPB51_001638 [Rhipicephalus microplus]